MDDNVIIITDVIFSDDTVTEDTIVKSDRNGTKYRMGIAVSGTGESERNFISDPYFKVFDGNNPNDSKYLARVSIMNPVYVYHNVNTNSRGQKHWNLSSKEKKVLIQILNSKLDPDSRGTVWDAILRECIKESQNSLKRLNIDEASFLKTKMPDYTQLK